MSELQVTLQYTKEIDSPKYSYNNKVFQVDRSRESSVAT
jgi:hypothetical protein